MTRISYKKSWVRSLVVLTAMAVVLAQGQVAVFAAEVPNRAVNAAANAGQGNGNGQGNGQGNQGGPRQGNVVGGITADSVPSDVGTPQGGSQRSGSGNGQGNGNAGSEARGADSPPAAPAGNPNASAGNSDNAAGNGQGNGNGRSNAPATSSSNGQGVGEGSPAAPGSAPPQPEGPATSLNTPDNHSSQDNVPATPLGRDNAPGQSAPPSAPTTGNAGNNAGQGNPPATPPGRDNANVGQPSSTSTVGPSLPPAAQNAVGPQRPEPSQGQGPARPETPASTGPASVGPSVNSGVNDQATSTPVRGPLNAPDFTGLLDRTSRGSVGPAIAERPAVDRSAAVLSIMTTTNGPIQPAPTVPGDLAPQSRIAFTPAVGAPLFDPAVFSGFNESLFARQIPPPVNEAPATTTVADVAQQAGSYAGFAPAKFSGLDEKVLGEIALGAQRSASAAIAESDSTTTQVVSIAKEREGSAGFDPWAFLGVSFESLFSLIADARAEGGLG